MSKNANILAGIRIAMVILLLAFIVFLQLGVRDSKASIETVTASVTETLDMENMQKSTNQMFKKFYGLNASEFDGVALFAPVTNMDAEELLIVRLKDHDQENALTDAVSRRIETQKSSFEGYGVEQYDLLENHILDVRGNYVLFVVHADASKADQAFRDSL